MRDDMAKVVTERPRRGHGHKSKKTTGLPIRRYDPDADYDEPVRLPIARRRQYGWDAKDFSDLINPLKRYLRSCIGRRWNKVHSELSRKPRAPTRRAQAARLRAHRPTRASSQGRVRRESARRISCPAP